VKVLALWPCHRLTLRILALDDERQGVRQHHRLGAADETRRAADPATGGYNQRFDLSQTFWCHGFNKQIFGADEQVPAVGKATKKRSALRVQSGKGPTSRHLLDINRSHTSC
jgi:hypothetical protein